MSNDVSTIAELRVAKKERGSPGNAFLPKDRQAPHSHLLSDLNA
jgi:hypothetical protein